QLRSFVTSAKKDDLSLHRLSSKAKSQLTAATPVERPFIKDWSLFDDLARAEAFSRGEGVENTVFGPDGKPYWIYSLPNHIQEMILRMADPDDSIFDDLSALPFYEHSRIV